MYLHLYFYNIFYVIPFMCFIVIAIIYMYILKYVFLLVHV